MKILAIDPSLNQTGIAFPDQQTLVLNPPKGVLGPARLVWVRDMIAGILTSNQMTGVVLEDYPLGVKNSSCLVQLAELGGVLRALFHELRLPVAFVNPSTLKKWVGCSKKEEVMATITHRTGRLFRTSDEADAWALGAMAAQHCGRPWTTMPAAQADAIGKVKWPAAWRSAVGA